MKAYLGALVAGQATTALQLLPASDSGASSALLNDAVYASTTRPSKFTLTNTTTNGRSATVTADITMDGKTSSTTFGLAQGGDTKGAFHGWKIASGPTSMIRVGSVAQVTVVNGVAVDLSTVQIGSALLALPGVYHFKAPSGTKLVSYGSDLTIVAGVSPGSDSAQSVADFVAQPTPEAERSAIEAVRAHVAHCMLSDAFRPEGCPNVLEMKDPVTYATSYVTRSWMHAPEYEFIRGGASDSPIAAGAFAVRVSGGDMRIDYRRRYTEGQQWTPDMLTLSKVFDRADPRGTYVGVTLDPETGLSFDYGAF